MSHPVSRAVAPVQVAVAALAVLLFAGAAHAGLASVRIINRSPVTVERIYTSATYHAQHGRKDLLGNGVIRPGASWIIDFDVPDADGECVQDVKAVGRDGRTWTWRMDVCEESQWSLGD